MLEDVPLNQIAIYFIQQKTLSSRYHTEWSAINA